MSLFRSQNRPAVWRVVAGLLLFVSQLFGASRDSLPPAPPPPVSGRYVATRGTTVAVPLTIHGTRNGQLEFLIRNPPKFGRLSVVRPNGLNSAVVNYTAPLDPRVTVDRFFFAVRSNEGVSAPAIIEFRIDAPAPPPEPRTPAPVALPADVPEPLPMLDPLQILNEPAAPAGPGHLPDPTLAPPPPKATPTPTPTPAPTPTPSPTPTPTPSPTPEPPPAPVIAEPIGEVPATSPAVDNRTGTRFATLRSAKADQVVFDWPAAWSTAPALALQVRALSIGPQSALQVTWNRWPRVKFSEAADRRVATVEGLAPGQLHTVRVVAISGEGEAGETVAAIQIRTPAKEPWLHLNLPLVLGVALLIAGGVLLRRKWRNSPRSGW